MATAKSDSEIAIRRATPGESQQISELALRSKAYWGYDAAFIEACRPILTLKPVYIATHPVFILEEQGKLIGFYSLAGQESEVELDHLFVEPDAIGQGYGKRLFRHAIETAKQLGFERMLIESEPYAEPFYLAMGAVRFGKRSSPARPDRWLPLLRLALQPDEEK